MRALELLKSDESRSLAKDLALLPPRAALGATMLYHGLEKLRGSREQTEGYFHAMGLRPARFWTAAVGITEACAGALTVLGVLTRPAALAVLATQSVAIAKVHAPKGFATMKGGYEFNLALMAIATAMLVGGPGRISIKGLADHALGHDAAPGPLERLRRARRRRRRAAVASALLWLVS
jgi:putative oxidoreductase